VVDSAKELLGRAFRNWGQFVGGPATGTVGLAATIFSWNIRPWAWIALSVLFFFLGIIQAYHQLRIECDAAMDGLRDKRDHQSIADGLIKEYDYGIHELAHKAPPWPTIQNDFPQFWQVWQPFAKQVFIWNDRVEAFMRRSGCSTVELSNFVTIPDAHLLRERKPNQITRAEWVSASSTCT
jgi:hypothetical protein